MGGFSPGHEAGRQPHSVCCPSQGAQLSWQQPAKDSYVFTWLRMTSLIYLTYILQLCLQLPETEILSGFIGARHCLTSFLAIHHLKSLQLCSRRICQSLMSEQQFETFYQVKCQKALCALRDFRMDTRWYQARLRQHASSKDATLKFLAACRGQELVDQASDSRAPKKNVQGFLDCLGDDKGDFPEARTCCKVTGWPLAGKCTGVSDTVQRRWSWQIWVLGPRL